MLKNLMILSPFSLYSMTIFPSATLSFMKTTRAKYIPAGQTEVLICKVD